MKYMLTKARVTEIVVEYCACACPGLQDDFVEAHERFRMAMSGAEKLLIEQNLQSTRLDHQTPERIHEAIERSKSRMQETIKDPYRFCVTHLDRMKSATAESLAQGEKLMLKTMDDEALM